MTSFKILTLNTHKGFSQFNKRFVLPEIRDAIRLVGADVVFLQEVQGEHQLHSKSHRERWPTEPHYEFLAESLWPEFAYGRNAVYPHGHHGNALLSKYPIKSHENHDVSVAGHEERGILYSVVELPGSGTRIHTMCVHMGLAEDHRRQQTLLLLKLMAEKVPADEPLVIAGDFNDWKLQVHQKLTAEGGVAECLGTAIAKPARTFPVWLPVLRLDRVYLRNAAVRNASVLHRHPWTRLSDHAPLLVEIEL